MLRSKISRVVTSKCPGCGTLHPGAVLEAHLYTCPECNRYLSMPSHARIANVADKETFRELDREMVSVDPLDFSDLKSYRVRLQEARRETGVREAVTTQLRWSAGLLNPNALNRSGRSSSARSVT